MESAGKARNNGLYRHIRTSKEIIRNLLNDYKHSKAERRLCLFLVGGCRKAPRSGQDRSLQSTRERSTVGRGLDPSDDAAVIAMQIFRRP